MLDLEDFYMRGAAAAQKHFEGVLEIARQTLPEALWIYIPTSRDGLSGLFTASSKRAAFSLFRNQSGHAIVQMNFKYKPRECEWPSWRFINYSLIVGPFGNFEFRAYTIEDAVLMSRHYAQHTATLEAPPGVM